jgi:hypothetical protein
MADDILDLVLAAARKKLLFLPHAVDQMNSPEQLITPEEVEDVIFQGVVIEAYPEDARGHSCLMGTQVTTGDSFMLCVPRKTSILL